jgi:hypothetical protein
LRFQIPDERYEISRGLKFHFLSVFQKRIGDDDAPQTDFHVFQKRISIGWMMMHQTE